MFPLFHSLSAASGASLLDKTGFEESYELFVQQTVKELTKALAASCKMTVAGLSDDLVTLCAVLHAEYPEAATAFLEKCRGFHPSAMFEAFDAQMREMYMSLEASSPQPVSFHHPLDGSWRYKSLSILFLSSEHCPSILSLLRASSMGVAFQIVRTSTSLHVRSQSLTQTWAEFHVDGLPHVHRVFPNGESTMAFVDGLVHGDYVAAIVNHSAVELVLYSWPTSSISRYCYAIHLHIAREIHGLAVDVHVAAALEVAPVQDYWCMTVQERVALYDQPNETPVVTCRLDYDSQK
ncbi:unnamed protein product [Aphanomyces euteiches]|uniref:Uncharacterized protein n=1 Tax=Aphanomyces euteiches TaxID=100861 RepID=A0A6G0W6J6_9STRA|nr:hypothetical protein Ae201684_018235 [Aphanomyces euteiches]KAH9150587.1 hypothetical protein AeRB84_006599 [Aphanomyces euteiches]